MNIKDWIFDFAYNEALIDATRRTHAAGYKESVSKNDEAKGFVREYANSILNGNHADFYETEKKVEECISNPKFTFGNTQKLINMTMKYLYIVCYHDIALRDIFEVCHCPMDKTMKDIVVKRYRKAVEEDGAPKDYSTFINCDGNESECWSDVSWSNIERAYVDKYPTQNVYYSYQKMVEYLAGKDELFPLEYDFKEFNKEQ